MGTITVEQIIQMAQQLTAPERAIIIHQLQATLSSQATPITRESIAAEHARREAAGEFAETVSLMGKYARPDLDLSFEQVQSIISEASR